MAEGVPVLSPGDIRAEAVSRIIQSGLFERSPGQERLFLFLCRRAISGQTADLKEFTIAVEAFGRTADFDPKLDSIVRVEMHRLRRRLKEYYTGKGAGDPVKIVLPEKSYEIEFLPDAIAEPLTPPDAAPAPRWAPVRWWLAAGLALAALLGIGLALRTDPPVASAGRVTTPLPAPPPVKPAANGDLRILCGRPAMRYIDPYGQAWEGDRYFTGGEAVALENQSALIGFDQNILAGMRAGTFAYEIPLAPGHYEVMLIFAEPALSAGNSSVSTEETREFSVRIQGRNVLSAFDVKDASGGYNVPHFRVFKDVQPDRAGLLRIEFPNVNGRGFLNALVVRSGIPGHMRPVRIVARREPFRDSQGNLWEPDRYFRGGRQILRPIPPRVPDSFLYIGERHGTFQYDIPVAAGSKYTVNLHFWESWWNAQQEGGPGSRVFSVYCNFRPLMERFDLLATGVDPPVIRKTFRGLEPDSNGKLSLSFVPHANRAMINAIEVIDEGTIQP